MPGLTFLELLSESIMMIREAIHIIVIPFFFNFAILQKEMRLGGIFLKICGRKFVVYVATLAYTTLYSG